MKSLIGFFVAASLLTLGGCDYVKNEIRQAKAEREPPHAYEDFLAKSANNVQEGVKLHLKDPDSARWGAIWLADDLVTICGYVNAKNSFGGYTGMRPFAGLTKSVVYMDRTEAPKLIWRACSHPPKTILVPGDPGPPAA